MSSTNRSDIRKSHPHDYYVTPVTKIKEFLVEFHKYEPDAFCGKVLDPCAGGDGTHAMSYPTALDRFGIDKDNITTIDIREDSLAQIKGNYLDIECKDYDVIITNPPFDISLDIIRKALKDVNDGGFVIMLLRLNYFGGKLREGFWDEYMPKYSFVHTRRISFTDDKNTDSIEFMHCVWQKGHYPEFCKLKPVHPWDRQAIKIK